MRSSAAVAILLFVAGSTLLPAILSREAAASGGTVVLRTRDTISGYYYRLAGTGNDRYISLYLPTDAPPGSTICGARVRELDQGAISSSRSLAIDLRAEDPANPGYPDLTPAGVIAPADALSQGTCSRSSAIPRIATFNAGRGVPFPGVVHFLTALEPVHGPGPYDFCGLLIDTSGPPRGFTMTYSRGTFQSPPWDHFFEEIIATPPAGVVVGARFHGRVRFPGDSGNPVVFARRANAAGVTTDDAVSLTFTLDNYTGAPFPLTVAISASLAGLVPGGGVVPLTARFRSVGSGAPVLNPIVFPPGRSAVLLEVPRPLPPRAELVAPLNIPFTLTISDPAAGGAVVAAVTQILGLRATPGEPDDGVPEALYVVQFQGEFGDAMAVRFRAVELPRTAPFALTGVEVTGGEYAMRPSPGFDAIEVRISDPVLANTPDLSSAGLVAAIGTLDGVGEIVLGPPPATLTIDVPDVRFNPAGGAFVPDLYAQVLLAPGPSTRATGVSADQAPALTILGDSFYSAGGSTPYVPDPTSNFTIRLLLDGRRATLSGEIRQTNGARKPFVREVGRFVPVDLDDFR